MQGICCQTLLLGTLSIPRGGVHVFGQHLVLLGLQAAPGSCLAFPATGSHGDTVYLEQRETLEK